MQILHKHKWDDKLYRLIRRENKYSEDFIILEDSDFNIVEVSMEYFFENYDPEVNE